MTRSSLASIGIDAQHRFRVLRPPFANQTGGKPVNGGTTKPTGTGTGTGPSGATGSPIVPYDASAASSLQAGWMGSIAMIIAAGIYLYA